MRVKMSADDVGDTYDDASKYLKCLSTEKVPQNMFFLFKFQIIILSKE